MRLDWRVLGFTSMGYLVKEKKAVNWLGLFIVTFIMR